MLSDSALQLQLALLLRCHCCCVQDRSKKLLKAAQAEHRMYPTNPR